jgi:hypothetical protein
MMRRPCPHRRLSSRLWLGLSSLATVLVLAPAALAAPPPTELVHVHVFSTTGRPLGVRVTRREQGSCFAGSIGLPRPDAWRCIVGNELLDPCLESPLGPSVALLCLDGASAIALRLTRPLPRSFANPPEHGFFAWRLVLSDGDVCERFTGTAAGSIQGQGLVYGCTSGGTTTEPDRARPAWTVRYLRKGESPLAVSKLSALRLLRVTRALG